MRCSTSSWAMAAATPQFTRAMSGTQSVDRLAELNVIEQMANVCRTTITQDAWRREQSLAVHGWIYSLKDGLLRDLWLSVTRDDALEGEYGRAVAALTAARPP
jgi:carbonic anhydrase